MKIEMNTIYHLPTQAHEDDFLKQADKQGLEWETGHDASYLRYWDDCKEQYCINVTNTGLGYSDKEFYQTDDKFNQLPIVEWKTELTKEQVEKLGLEFCEVVE